MNKYICFLLLLSVLLIFYACDRYNFLSEDDWNTLYGKESGGSGSISAAVSSSDSSISSSSTGSASNNAYLYSLRITSGTISPVFNSSIMTYTCSVNVTNVYVTAAADDPGASLEVQVNTGSYMAIVSGVSSNGLTLNAGAVNSIKVRVTAEDSSEKIYSINVSQIDLFFNFEETFDFVPDGTNIRPPIEAERTLTLDNPDSFIRSNISGAITAGTTVSESGAIEMSTQRMLFIVPQLSTLINPLLRVTVKNDDGLGIPVTNLTLWVGDTYSTSGNEGAAGHRAHGTYPVYNNDYQVLEISLNKSFIGTNGIQFRAMVGTSGEAGLFINKIEVVEGP